MQKLIKLISARPNLSLLLVVLLFFSGMFAPVFNPGGYFGLGSEFPSSPATYSLFIITDDSAAGACDSDAGAAVSFCYFDGADWASIGAAGGVTGWPTDSTTKVITWATSFANAIRFEGATSGRGTAIYDDATLGPQVTCYVAGVENDCNYSRWLLTGKTFSFLANDRTTAIGTVTSAATSGAWTNMTVDAEATGNVITTTSKVNFAPVACSGTTGSLNWDTNATLAPTATCVAGSTNTTLIQGYADFPDSDGEYQGQLHFRLPAGWTGAVDLQAYWKAAATSGDVVWQTQTMCTADAEIEDVAWNTADAFPADTAKGTTLQLNTVSDTGITMTGCAAGELLHIKFFRQRTHASDTITGVVSLKNVEMTLRRAQ